LPAAGIKLLAIIGSVKADEARQQRAVELQIALRAFNLPPSISVCYEFGGRITSDQLPSEVRIDKYGSSARYCRFMGKIGLAWSQGPDDAIIRGIVMMWEPKHVETFATHLHRHRDHTDLPLLLVFIGSLVYIQIETHSMRHHENGIRYAEMQTGYHRFNHAEIDDDAMMKEDYAELSRYVSGKAGVIAVMKFRLSEFAALLAMVTAEINNYIASNADRSRPDGDLTSRLRLMQNRISTLQQLSSSYINESECLRERASIQLTALFNLISKKDRNLSIEIAKDSKTLAVESKRDSSSMKTLAVVTMVFLPRTFVAVSLAFSSD
jgi:hypothetical protein